MTLLVARTIRTIRECSRRSEEWPLFYYRAGTLLQTNSGFRDHKSGGRCTYKSTTDGFRLRLVKDKEGMQLVKHIISHCYICHSLYLHISIEMATISHCWAQIVHTECGLAHVLSLVLTAEHPNSQHKGVIHRFMTLLSIRVKTRWWERKWKIKHWCVCRVQFSENLWPKTAQLPQHNFSSKCRPLMASAAPTGLNIPKWDLVVKILS
jgi:hypothetical protein